MSLKNLPPSYDPKEVSQALAPLMAWVNPIIAEDISLVLSVLRQFAQSHADCLDSQQLESSVRRAFSKPILEICYRTLLLELGIARFQNSLRGATPEARFADFLSTISSPAGRLQLDLDYPLLRAQVVSMSMNTARHLITLLMRVTRDFDQIKKCLLGKGPKKNPLTDFETGMGDRHIHGASVVRLQFAVGAVFYKPRQMEVEAEFARFIQFLNQHKVGPDQQFPATINCGEYGYAEEVVFKEVANEADLRSFYQRFGGLIAITHILGTTDLHNENIMARGAYPLMIDSETLFQPNFRSDTKNRYCYGESVMRSCLLPTVSASGQLRDTSALYTPKKSFTTRVPLGTGTDQLMLQEREITTSWANSMPGLNGAMANPHCYVKEICDGFESTYRALLSLKSTLLAPTGPLAPFKLLSVRVVVRPTQTYAETTKALMHPDYLKSDKKREALVLKLKTARKKWPEIKEIWLSERLALLRGDIPYFTAQIDQRDIYNEDGQSMGQLLSEAAWSVSQQHIHSLSPADLARQLRIIHQATICLQSMDDWQRWLHVYPETPLNHQSHTEASALSATLTDQDYVNEARRIADHIIQSGFHSSKHANHLQLNIAGKEHLRVSHMDANMYSGTSGLAIFFGEVFLQSKESVYLDYCHSLLQSARQHFALLRRYPGPVGAFSGMAGWIYTLTLLGHRMQRANLIDEAISWLPWLTTHLAQDKVMDVIGGAAGTLLVLTELERIAPGRGALSVARLCAEHLATHATEDERGASWVSEGTEAKIALTGFSHGTAGIAAALARYIDLNVGDSEGNQKYINLINNALKFERASYDGQGWCDERTQSDHDHSHDHHGSGHPYSWCHGGPGIGLSRLLIPESMRDADWHLDVERCLSQMQARGFGGGHNLCHGQLGNLELLMQFADVYPERAELQHWKQIAGNILRESQQHWRSGNFVGCDEFDLMTGLAGIGYEFLRVTKPHEIPSVLMLEFDTSQDRTKGAATPASQVK